MSKAKERRLATTHAVEVEHLAAPPKAMRVDLGAVAIPGIGRHTVYGTMPMGGVFVELGDGRVLLLTVEAVSRVLVEAATQRHCRVCGCTEAFACEGGCHWAEADLCSACVGAPKRKRGAA